MEYLFVYGTLMQKYPKNPLIETLRKKTIYIGEAFTYGKLYLVDYYPGLLPNSPTENHKIFGEIVEIMDSTLWKELDDYEDCRKSDVSNSLYIRKIVPSFLVEDSRQIQTHTYFYNKSVNNLNFLKNGRFY